MEFILNIRRNGMTQNNLERILLHRIHAVVPGCEINFDNKGGVLLSCSDKLNVSDVRDSLSRIYIVEKVTWIG